METHNYPSIRDSAEAPAADQDANPLAIRRAAKLSVTVERGIAALRTYAVEIDRLNLASTRPNVFHSSAFLQCYARHVEYYTPDTEERVFLVRDGDRLIGCAPMRRSSADFGAIIGRTGLRTDRLGFLAPFDTEQPGLLCAPADEDRVAAALVHHLCAAEQGWGMLEFVGQRPGRTLHRIIHAAANRRFRARDIAVEPISEVSLVWPDLASYFRSLAKPMRSNISRQARKLFASGESELILAAGPEAVSAWFNAYCELDGRSWKRGTASSIQRHPRRVEFYREIVAGRGGLDPLFIGVLLNGELVAGLIAGDNSRASPETSGVWCLEMAYDNAYAKLGPAQLLLLLAVGEAIKHGNKFVNFLQNFAYYKHRWKADPIEVVNVQLMRRFGPHDVRGLMGELKRKWRPGRAASRLVDSGGATVADAAAGVDVARADFDRARKLAAAACAAAGAGMIRLDRALAGSYLPFALD